jgi:hypothetical protein
LFPSVNKQASYKATVSPININVVIIVLSNNILPIKVFLLLLFSFESFEELPYEVSSESIEYLIESFILELSCIFISSPSPSSSSVSLLLTSDLSSSSMELLSSSVSE